MSEIPFNKSIDGPQGEIPSQVATNLRSLRRRIIFWFVVDGLVWLMGLFVLLVIFDLGLDYLFRMDWAQRCVMFVLMLGGLIAMFIWRLVIPLQVRLSDDALCLEVEGQNKQLGEQMISGVQFSRLGDISHQGVSMDMVRATIDAGTRAAEYVNFGGVLNTTWLKVNLMLLFFLSGIVVLGGISVAQSPTMAIWFHRNVLLSNERWPQDIDLEIVDVKDGQIVLPRGEDRQQIVKVLESSKTIPDAVYIDFRSRRSRPRQKMNPVGNEAPPREFSVIFKNVLDEFEFRARARDSAKFWHRDATTEWIRVKLVEQPALENVRIDVTPPKYTGGKTIQLPPGKGPYYILQGSTLAISGKANKPIQEGKLRINEDEIQLSVSSEIDVKVTVPPEKLQAGKFIIDLTDTTGMRSKRPTTFGMRIRTDREPRVQAKLLGVSGMVVPRARIPLDCRVSDDFSVTNVALKFKWQGDKADSSGDGTVEFEDRKPLFGAPEVEFDDIFDLELLEEKIPTGRTLTFTILATDNDNITVNKPPGMSSEFLLRVVTEEELRADLLRREKEQREEFQRLLNNQEELLTNIQALAADAKGAFTKEQKELIRTTQRKQKLIGTNVAAIAQRFETYLIEAENNRLNTDESDREKYRRRLERQIISPMYKLSDIEIPLAEDGIHRSRQLDIQGASREEAFNERTTALNEVASKQEDVVDEMRRILSHMVKAEGFQVAVNLLYQLEKEQKGVLNKTLEELDKLLRELLEEGGNADLPQDDKKSKDDEAKGEGAKGEDAKDSTQPPNDEPK